MHGVVRVEKALRDEALQDDSYLYRKMGAYRKERKKSSAPCVLNCENCLWLL